MTISDKKGFLSIYTIRNIPKYILKRVKNDSSNHIRIKTKFINKYFIQIYFSKKALLFKIFGKRYLLHYYKLYGFIIKEFKKHKYMKKNNIKYH